MSSHITDLDAPLTKREAAELCRLLEKLLIQSAPTPNRALNVDEVIERLGISRPHLYRLFEKGVVKKSKLGGRTVVWEADLAALATKGKR
jgi:predicted DNA-binding transcriptional regulator AlpA